MGMTVHRLVESDVEPPGEVVVLVARATRRETLQEGLEVTQQERLVLIDRQAYGRVERLKIDAAEAEACAADLVAELGGDVDELRGAGGLEPEPLGDHRPLSRAPTRSSRTGLPAPPERGLPAPPERAPASSALGPPAA